MFNMIKTRLVAAVFTAATAVFAGSICMAQPAPVPPAQTPVQPVPAQMPLYRIKSADFVVPPDVPLGQYRRIFRPFENWTLICDENLKAQQMVCNVTQSVLDASGATVFSWSLAAAASGQPFFILRTTPDSDTAAGIVLKIGSMATPLQISFDGCNQSVCLGKLAIGPLLRVEIERGAEIQVSYRLRSGQTRDMRLPFKGLDQAVSSIGDNGIDKAINSNKAKQPASASEPAPAVTSPPTNTNKSNVPGSAPAKKPTAPAAHSGRLSAPSSGRLSVPPKVDQE